jgi:hypothetical protein
MHGIFMQDEKSGSGGSDLGDLTIGDPNECDMVRDYSIWILGDPDLAGEDTGMADACIQKQVSDRRGDGFVVRLYVQYTTTSLLLEVQAVFFCGRMQELCVLEVKLTLDLTVVAWA